MRNGRTINREDLQTLPPTPDFLQLEYDVQRILTEQELYGWAFDEVAARELEETLRRELESSLALLRNRYPYVPGKEFCPKRSNRTLGYIEGAPLTKLQEFNPTSRAHISWVLQTHTSWQPKTFTDTGKPKLDEAILKELGTDLALQFYRNLEIQKQLGMLSEGQNAWLKLVKNGRIHHHCSVATNTHRCAHRKPNLAQVPSGDAFRRLFIANPPGVLVGADLSGIELRLLAHYLSRYDGGRYADILLNGDIHQVNADKIGISRKLVKTVTYAFLYGAGTTKIGLSYDKTLSPSKASKKGKEIAEAYIAAIPGLDKLLAAVKQAAARGYVQSLDKRKILVESEHKALNYLLQSAAAVLAKRWMVITNETVKSTKIDAHQVGFIHDELQYELNDPNQSEQMEFALTLAAVEAGEFYKLRIPIAAEAVVGHNWEETH